MDPGAFRCHHEVAVRFRDLDPMGHAHHSLPLIFFEEGRAAYWREVAGREGLGGIDYIMGGFELRVHGRIHFPGRLDVGVRTVRLGRSSFDMEYGLWSAGGELLASGGSAQVMYDYAASASKPIPGEVRRRIEAHEGLSGDVAPG